MISTKGQIEDFFATQIWKDIVDELEAWKKDLYRELANDVAVLDSGERVLAHDSRVIDRFGGSVETLERVINQLKGSMIETYEIENYE